MNILLDAITKAAKNKEVTFNEVVDAYNLGSTEQYPINPSTQPTSTPGKNTTTSIIASIGTFLIFIGLGIFMSNYWGVFSSNQRLFASLGIGLILFYLSYFVSYRFRETIVSNILILISFFWLNWGIIYSVDKIVSDVNDKTLTYGLILLSLAILYFTIFKYLKKSLYFIILNICGTASFVLILSYLLRGVDYSKSSEILTLGVSTASITGLAGVAYYWKNLTNWVRNLSLFGFFSSLIGSSYAYFIYLAQWITNKDLAQLLYSIVFIITYIIAIKWQSKTLLILNSIFLYFYILTLTTRYFNNDNIPLVLIFAGSLLLGISYITYYLSKRINRIKI
jgi:hypothetical protein